MVKITKLNCKPMKVTEAAYENFYKNAGWQVSASGRKKSSPTPASEPEPDSGDDWDNLDDYEPEKSLSEMSLDELREKAVSMGIDLSGVTTAKQVRDKIKRYM